MLQWLAAQANNPIIVLFDILSMVTTLVAFFGDRLVVIVGGGQAQTTANLSPSRAALGSIAAVLMLTASILLVSRTFVQPTPPLPTLFATTQPPPSPDVTAMANAAFTLGADHRYAEALGVYRLIEQASPSFPFLHLDMAYCLRELGDLSAASAYAEKAVQDALPAGSPAIGTSYYNLAAIRFAAGDRSAALGSLAAAVGAGFPDGCDVTKDDPDLKSMAEDAALAPYVQNILADSSRDCGSGK